MKSALTVVLFRLFTIGVFVDGKEESNVSVMEGDSVTLKSGVTDVQTDDDIEWRFNGNSIDKSIDGLQLDSQTGDLKISNIRTTDSGLYKVKISSPRGSSEVEFNVTVVPADEVKSVSVMVGDSVTLRPDVPDIQRVDVIRWRFGQQKSLVAEINRMDEIFNKSDGPDERFRSRLELDHQTGYLIITNITTEHAGLYEAEISSTRSRYTIHHTQSFSVTGRDEVKSVSVLEGDSVTLRTGLTEIQIIKKILWKFEDQDIADLKTWRNIDMNSQTRDLTIRNIRRDQRGDYKVEIITRRMILHRKYRITIGEMTSVSVKKGESVTLQIIVTEIQSDDLIYWMFGNFNLAKFNKKEQQFYTSDVPDKRFKGRLDLDHQTGSLTIMNINPTHAGDYKLKIISSRHIINRKITVTVSDEVMSVMKGNRVTLNTGVTKNPDDTLLWYFEDTLIALVNGHPEDSCLYYGKGEIFKDRLDMDHKTGSLIITTSRPEHTGRYEAEFIKHDNTGKTETIIMGSKCDQTKINPKGSDLVIHKSFSLTVSDVFGEVMSAMEGNPVTLNTGVTKNPDDTLLWYFEHTLIALVSGHPNTSCLYYGKGEIFKDRLDVDHKTGSLIITTSRPEHTGRYEAEFIEGKPGKTKTFNTIPKCDHTKINPKGSDLVIHKSFSLTVSDAGLSSGAVAGIVVAVFLLVAAVAGFVCYRRKNSERESQRVENGVNRNTQKTDDPATEETKLNDS